MVRCEVKIMPSVVFEAWHRGISERTIKAKILEAEATRTFDSNINYTCYVTHFLGYSFISYKRITGISPEETIYMYLDPDDNTVPWTFVKL